MTAFQGTYNPTFRPPLPSSIDNNALLGELEAIFTDDVPSHLPAQRGKILVYSEGAHGEYRIKAKLVMQGELMTYGTCVLLLQGFRDYLNGNRVLNTHLLEATISVHDERKIAFGILYDVGSPVRIGPDLALSFRGRYFPQRPLLRSGIIAVLNSWDSAAAAHPPSDLISDLTFSTTRSSRGVQIGFRFDPDHRPTREGPPATYRDTRNLFAAVRDFYNSAGGMFGNEITGNLYYNGVDVGFFFVQVKNLGVNDTMGIPTSETVDSDLPSSSATITVA